MESTWTTRLFGKHMHARVVKRSGRSPTKWISRVNHVNADGPFVSERKPPVRYVMLHSSTAKVIITEMEYQEVLADMPPVAQDEHALARIDDAAPITRYPLLPYDRRSAPIHVLVVYLFRVLRWRWVTRFERRIKPHANGKGVQSAPNDHDGANQNE